MRIGRLTSPVSDGSNVGGAVPPDGALSRLRSACIVAINHTGQSWLAMVNAVNEDSIVVATSLPEFVPNLLRAHSMRHTSVSIHAVCYPYDEHFPAADHLPALLRCAATRLVRHLVLSGRRDQSGMVRTVERDNTNGLRDAICQGYGSRRRPRWMGAD